MNIDDKIIKACDMRECMYNAEYDITEYLNYMNYLNSLLKIAIQTTNKHEILKKSYKIARYRQLIDNKLLDLHLATKKYKSSWQKLCKCVVILRKIKSVQNNRKTRCTLLALRAAVKAANQAADAANQAVDSRRPIKKRRLVL